MGKIESESLSTPARPGETPPSTPGAIAPAPRPEVGAETGRDAGRIPTHMVPLVAAFDAGRLWNRLRFYLEQSWFLYGNPRQAARGVVRELGLTVRILVPAAERRGLQEAVTRPIEELLERMESEVHHDHYENWSGEFADRDLTDDDYHRALEPAFEALAAVRRTIEEELEGMARLVFHLGELLDRGACPPNVHRHLGRPRPTRNQAAPPPETGSKALTLKPGMQIKRPDAGQPEEESRWRSVRPGDVARDPGWDDEVLQLLTELALWLGLSPGALLLEEDCCHEPVVKVVDRINERVRSAMANWPEEVPVEASAGPMAEEPSRVIPSQGPQTTAPTVSPPSPLVPCEVTSASGSSGEGEEGTGGAPAGKAPTRRGAAWDAKSEARHKFAYDKVCDVSLQLTQGLAQFNNEASKQQWVKVGSTNSLKYLAQIFAKKYDLPELPSRQGE